MNTPLSHWFRRFRQDGRVSARVRSRRTCLNLEQLEDRRTPAVYQVNTLADLSINGGVNLATGRIIGHGNTVTLRSAIEAANHVPGNNTIKLAVPGTYKIALPGTPGETDNQGGEFAILAKPGGGNLSIKNSSGRPVRVDGNHVGRVFDINPSQVFTATLSGAQQVPAVATPGTGTATIVYSPDQSTITVNISSTGLEAAITAQHVHVGAAGTNGPVAQDANGSNIQFGTANPATGAFTVDNSTAHNPGGFVSQLLAGNTYANVHTSAFPGGEIRGQFALAPKFAVSMKGFTIQNGIAAPGGGPAGTGGGIRDQGNVDLTLTNMVVKSNRAAGDGGGISNAGNGAIAIVNSVVARNFSGGLGGGFSDPNNQGTLTVRNSLFLNNVAIGNGGGIQQGGPSTTISNTQIDGNSSGGMGGGLFANGTTLFVRRSTIANNTSVGDGGGIQLQTTGTGPVQGSTIANATITGNSALNNAGANGGGINAAAAFTGDLKLLNDTINGNFASVGGGFFWAGSGNVAVQNTILAKNTAMVAPDVSTNELFTATLNGAQQVPPVATPGMGSATVVFNPDQNTVAVAISSSATSTITAQHLHVGAAGTNGPVAQDANGHSFQLGTANPATGTFTVDDSTAHNPGGFVSQLLAGNIYSNVHTTDLPSGEIRGQLALVAGALADLGGNLIGVSGPGSGNSGFTAGATQTGTVAKPLDPRLGPCRTMAARPSELPAIR